MVPQPGILYVTMAPSLPAPKFHDWYNNEHGPGRLRLPQVFRNGFRYKATDGDLLEWMAIYDVTDMKYLLEDVYTSLRKEPKQSQRERDTMKQIKVNRKFYDLLNEVKKPDFKELEQVEYEGSNEAETVIMAVLFKLKGESEEGKELGRWYDEEHIPLLSKVPGWRRSRRFVTSNIEPVSDPKETEYLALHEYDPINGLDTSAEFKHATNTPWRTKIFDTIVANEARRTYSLYYTFGPAPRDLTSLTDPSTHPFTSAYQRTITLPSNQGYSWPAIESVITTADGVPLPYRLEGNPNPQAPLLLLINSILVNHTIWTSFLQSFLPANPQYRILRYDARGRSALPATTNKTSQVTVELLAADAITLLDALRVPRAAGVIGVSLGGATALCLALRHPERVGCFVSCDTNSFAPPSNPQAWEDRIALAEKDEGAVDEEGQRLVGCALADATARRWFMPAHHFGPVFEEIKKVVGENSLEGFKKVVKALYGYDLRPFMKDGKVKGLFAVGSADGVLPKTMPEMARSYGVEGTRCEVVERAGHLPMVEQPERFSQVVSSFLKS